MVPIQTARDLLPDGTAPQMALCVEAVEGQDPTAAPSPTAREPKQQREFESAQAAGGAGVGTLP